MNYLNKSKNMKKLALHWKIIIGMVLGVALVVVGSDSIQFVLNIIGLIVSCVYFALMESSGMQGTLGKRL